MFEVVSGHLLKCHVFLARRFMKVMKVEVLLALGRFYMS